MYFVVAGKHVLLSLSSLSSLSYSGVYFIPIVTLQFDLSHALYAYYGTMFHIVSEIYERQIEPLSFSHLWTGLHGCWALSLFVDRSLPSQHTTSDFELTSLLSCSLARSGALCIRQIGRE